MLRERFAVFVAGWIAEEDEIIRGGSGKGEGIFQICSHLLKAFGRSPIPGTGGKFDIGIEPVEVGAATPRGLVAFN